METETKRMETPEAVSAIARVFGEYQTRCPNPKYRRYPEELKQMIRAAREEGIGFSDLTKATGVARSAIVGWVKTSKVNQPMLRKLKVVGAEPERAGMIVILPSGVRIEMPGSRVLGGEFLRELASLGRVN
jgi:transposase-like protein